MEADLREYYQLALRDLFTGRLRIRELINLVRNLPPESRTARLVLSRSQWRAAIWDEKTELLAVAVDALRGANWQRGEGKGREPDPYPRPGG